MSTERQQVLVAAGLGWPEGPVGPASNLGGPGLGWPDEDDPARAGDPPTEDSRG